MILRIGATAQRTRVRGIGAAVPMVPNLVSTEGPPTMHVKGSLVVRANAMDQAFYEAKWRDENGRQVKRRLGAAWLDRTDAGGWIQPSGRVPSGLTEPR
jgi:hypothetical protein